MGGQYSSRLVWIFTFGFPIFLILFVSAISCSVNFELSDSQGKPTFESSFENITVEEGSKVEMNCRATGKTPITYQWYKNEDEISEVSENSFISISKSTTESTLVIQNVKKLHDGVYICSATNGHGLSSKLYELTVLLSKYENDSDNGNKISSILNVTTVKITSNSVVFSIDIAGRAESIEIQYIEARNGTVHTIGIKRTPDDTYEIEGLIPAGSYRFQFRSVPSEDGKWSSEHTVVLLPDTPEVIFQSMAGGTIKIQWLRKFDDIMRGTIDRYELKYFLVQMQGGNSWLQNDCVITILLPSCASSSYTISGLFRNTFYEIQLTAHTASGYGEPYKQKLFFPG